MDKKSKLKKVILLGSGALKIGEAGEFDYSGSQAAKALKEEGIQTVLINPNIATIQTSPDFTNKVYFLPVSAYFVKKIIEKEKPDGILLGFGGQTALNCGLELSKKGIFKKYNVKVLGTPISAIEKTEDRLSFRKAIEDLGLKVPKSILCKSLADVKKASNDISYPVIVRAGFSLGGLGSGIARNKAQLEKVSKKALTLKPQILVEEYLRHWKEIEYEVVRDKRNNAVTICNMENFDPMGIHTGESIVVAPSQTLNNKEYHRLRKMAIEVVKSLPIVGECNIQFALCPNTGDYRIIEVNARLSRSSALASKATGYPLAYIGAKLALGYLLKDIKNQVTKATCAFFEPALDYVVVKIPRWDFLKFRNVEGKLGSEMQSVGEVMAIGRTFEEAFQKAIRSLDIDYEGIISDDLDKEKILKNKGKSSEYKDLLPTPSRPYNMAFNLFYGQSEKDIFKKTGIDYWFIQRIKGLVDLYKQMIDQSVDQDIDKNLLKKAKEFGFSDQQIAEVYQKSWRDIRTLRKKCNIVPYVCQIDTLAGEFPAKTNYLYMSYLRSSHDIKKEEKENKIAILGSGPYQIGSSVEFDWCAVNSVLTAKKLGYSPIMINCNPETVSTDYDISDKLYFEELTRERVLDIAEFEKCPFIVSVGGQIPNSLALKLDREKVKLLGSKAKTIDLAENRERFSALLDRLGIKQPVWKKFKNEKKALEFAQRIGYPVLVRPSYVLSGKAMFVAYSKDVLKRFLKKSTSIINSEYPMVISKFVRGAREVDFDAVAQKGKILAFAISEHVEHAGVHSGDATLVLPSFSLEETVKEQIRKISKKLIRKLAIDGPINIQYLVQEEENRDHEILVIEANLRASRSFPFVSKVLGLNFIELATKVILQKNIQKVKYNSIKHTGVKAPHFSFTRLRQVDPVLGVEMSSTGEVACFGEDIYGAYLKSILSTGVDMPKKSALLSVGGNEYKNKILPSARTLAKMGFQIYATKKTSDFLQANNIKSKFVYKVHENQKPNVADLIHDKKVSLVINLSGRSDLGVRELSREISDGYLIRRAAVDANIPLFTKISIASLFIKTLEKYTPDKLKVKSWGDYFKKRAKIYTSK